MKARLSRHDWSLIGTAACSLTIAYPPFRLVVPAFVCLVPATLLILAGATDVRPWRRHLHQGFWYGAITHGVLLYWLALALWQVRPSAIALYLVGAVMFGGAYAVMFALVGQAARGSIGRLVLALPAGIVFVEWLAAEVGPIGFPWHQLALAVTATPVLVQAADIAGVGGLGFALAAINTSLALAWWTRRDRRASLGHVARAGILLLVLVGYGLYRVNTLPMIAGADVAVVQPNVTLDEKWMPEHENAIVDRTMRLTEHALADPSVAFVAWPETAMPDAIQLHSRWTTGLSRLAQAARATVLAGGVDLEVAASGVGRRYNAAFAFSPGRVADRGAVYRKRQLVPVVERPVGATLDLSRGDAGGFTPGRAIGIAESSMGRYGVLLCYELTFAALARETRRAGASVLVTLSNDAWFGRTSAPQQHFAHAALRAVENRVSVIRAANTGVSGIVDPLGRSVVRTKAFVETYAVGRIQRVDVVPLAVHLGGYVGPFLLALLVVLAAAPRRGRQRGQSAFSTSTGSVRDAR